LEHQSLRYEWYYSIKQNFQLNELVRFDALTFVRLIEDIGNVLVVGDSVSELSSLSWRNKFLIQLHNNPTKYCYSVLLPNSNLSVYHIRNDLLTLQRQHHVMHEGAFINHLNDHKIALLILNRGAHYHNDHDLLRDVNHTFDYLTRYHPNVRRIYVMLIIVILCKLSVLQQLMETSDSINHRHV
jgi:hypothetical protein